MTVQPYEGRRTMTSVTGRVFDRSLTPATVYTFFGESDEPLYVGCTTQQYVRFQGHATKPWWTDVARIAVEHFEDRSDGLRRERQLIRELRPLYNQEHHPDHAEDLRRRRGVRKATA